MTIGFIESWFNSNHKKYIKCDCILLYPLSTKRFDFIEINKQDGNATVAITKSTDQITATDLPSRTIRTQPAYERHTRDGFL